MTRFKLFLILLMCLKSYNAFTQTSLFDQQMQIGFVEKQGQYADLTAKLVNENGDTVLLKDVINKPTILNLVYYQMSGNMQSAYVGNFQIHRSGGSSAG